MTLVSRTLGVVRAKLHTEAAPTKHGGASRAMEPSETRHEDFLDNIMTGISSRVRGGWVATVATDAHARRAIRHIILADRGG